MKTKLLLFFFLLTSILSCKKDKKEENSKNQNAPTADFLISRDTVNIGDTLTITDVSLNSTDRQWPWAWMSVCDAKGYYPVPSSSKTATIYYETQGVHSFSMQAINQYGYSTVTKQILVKGGKWVSVKNDCNNPRDIIIKGSDIFVNNGAYALNNPILKSSDGGNTWSGVGSNLPKWDFDCDYSPEAYNFPSLVICNNKLFVVVDSGTTDNNIQSLYKSNNGNTWSFVCHTYRSILFSDGSKLYMSSGSQGSDVCISSNEGVTWTCSNTNDKYFEKGGIAVLGNSIYIICYDKINISTNNGASWTTLNSSGLSGEHPLSIGTCGSSLIAATEQGIFTSTNYGANWSKINLDVPQGYIFSGPTPYDVDYYSGFLYYIGNNILTNISYYFAGDQGVGYSCGSGGFISQDNGSSWQSLGMIITDCIILGNDIYSISGSQIYKCSLSDFIKKR